MKATRKPASKRGRAVRAIGVLHSRAFQLFALSLGLLLLPRAGAQTITNVEALVNQFMVGDPQLGTSLDGPKGIAAADFDGDGNVDLAVSDTDGSVTVSFGRGQAKFGDLIYLRANSGSLRGITTADLNHDGLPDIAVAAPYANRICIFYNQGSRRFSPVQFLPAWHGARSVLATDLNLDGWPDLLVAGPNGGLKQFKNLGQNGFSNVTTIAELDSISLDPNTFPRPFYSLRTFRPPGFFVDYVLATHALAAQVWVLAPNAQGILEIQSSIATSAAAHGLAVGEIFHPASSGIKDLLVVQRDAGTIEIFHAQNTNGFTFLAQGSQKIFVPGGPRAAEVVDLNLDGWNDLVVIQRNLDNVLTYMNSNGVLTLSSERPVGRSPRELIVARLDGDPYPDVAVMNRDSGDVSVLTASPGKVGYRGINHLYLVDGNVVGLTVSDFNHDGRDDVIQLHRSSGDFSVRLANPDGTLQDPVFYTAGNVPAAQVFVDVNNDGNRDVVSANLGTIGIEKGWVTVRLGNGDGTFGPEQRFNLPSDTEGRLFALVPGDFDGDGNMDLAAGFLDSRIAFLRGHGDGSFELTRTHPFVHNARALVAGDFDQDGDIDLAGVGATSELWVVENESPNNLLETANLKVQVYPRPAGPSIAARTMIATDHNGDGDLDLVLGSGKGAWLYLGGPGMSFGTPTQLAGTERFVSDLLFADVDRDGNKDLVISCKDQDCLSVFSGSSNGQYRLTLPLNAPASKFIATGDLDGDGLPDIVGSGRVLWTVLSGHPAVETPPLVLSAPRTAATNAVINEILALNTSLPVAQDENKNVDWVEIYNGGNISFTLNGWRMRLVAPDDNGLVSTNEFSFPPTAFFTRGSHLLVFFSKSRRTPYHTGFALPAEGGTLTLLNASGAEVDKVVYPPQRGNISYARYRDGLRSFVFNPFPSAGMENSVNGDLQPDFKFRGIDPTSLAPGVPLRILAEAADDVGLTSVTMYYQRLDEPNSDVQSVIMFDDGLHNDGAAGDGVYVADLIEGFPEGAEIQFYFEVRDLDDDIVLFPEEPEFGIPGAPGNAYQVAIRSRSAALPLELSEIVALNNSGLQDEAGGTPDWIEVRNTSSISIPLADFALSHQIGDVSRYYFPSNSVLGPGEYIVVFCDDNIDQGPYHAPFRIEPSSDLIMLTGITTNNSRTLVDWTSFSGLAADQAWARMGAGGPWRKCTPTPYTGNLVEPYLVSVSSGSNPAIFTLVFPAETNKIYTVESCPELPFGTSSASPPPTGAAAVWSTVAVVPGTGIEQVIRTPAVGKAFFRIRREPE